MNLRIGHNAFKGASAITGEATVFHYQIKVFEATICQNRHNC
jgi:hypothetical protein